jgi:DNA-binding MarR family transcriptional regulator
MPSEAPIYVRLFHLLRAVREASAFSTLSADEEQLLGELIAQWHDTGSITVTEVMQSATRTSQSTVYRRLVALRNKGLISFRSDTDDKRLKFVEPTRKAKTYMLQLGSYLEAIVKAPPQS